MYKQGRAPRRRWPLILGVAAVFIAAVVTGGIIVARRMYTQNLQAVSGNQKRVIIEVPEGSTISDIARLLKDNGLIRSTWAFEQYIRANKLSDSLLAGTYVLQPSQTVAEIVSTFTEGKVKTDLVTILPGKRLDQVRQALLQSGFEATAVDKALNPATYIDHPALVDKPFTASLEGYLYPESFQKTATTTPEEVVGLALDEMQKRLTPTVRSQIEKQGLTVYEGIILASIIEMEVRTPSEKAQAAQVFISRLNKGMRLESDATIIYGAVAAGQPPSLTYDSDYNTYNRDGLPPGPISNVSEASLNAVANPSNTDWLYFVSGDDGVTHFSRTLAEHEALTAQYCKELCGN